MPLERTAATTSWSELVSFKICWLPGNRYKGADAADCGMASARLAWSDTRWHLLTTTLMSRCFRYLTDADLEKIGVSLGHRRKVVGGDCRACAARPNGTGVVSHRRRKINRTLPQGWRRWPRGAPPPPSASAAGRRRATLSHGDVLRSGRFYKHFCAARRRGVARPRWLLSRCRFRGGDGDGRPRR